MCTNMTHSLAQTCFSTCSYIATLANKCMSMQLYRNTHIHIWTYDIYNTHMHAHIGAQLAKHTCMHNDVLTHIHAYTQFTLACTHSHMHAHVHTNTLLLHNSLRSCPELPSSFPNCMPFWFETCLISSFNHPSKFITLNLTIHLSLGVPLPTIILLWLWRSHLCYKV